MALGRFAWALACAQLCLLLEPGAAQDRPAFAAPTPSVADWRRDLDAIVGDIRLLHPDPFTKIGALTFLRRVAALREALPAMTEDQRVVEAMRLVASICDGHTQLEPLRPDFASWYPVRFYEFTDGLFVTAAHRSVADLAGAQVLDLGGQPAAAVAAAARGLLGADNASGALEGLYALHNARLMRGLGFASAKGDLAVTFRLRTGTVVRRTLRPLEGESAATPEAATFEWRFRREMYGPPIGGDTEWVSAYRGTPLGAFAQDGASRPAHLADLGRYSARALTQQDAFYARMDILDDGFMPFLDSVLRQADAQRPRRLLLDWRYNVGGDGSLVPAISREFIKRRDAPPWRELYVFVGRRTFSAAIMLLNALLEQVPLTIVGEPPGGAFNHYGDATSRTYPRTGLRLRVSTLWWQLRASNDISAFIPVDVAAPFSSSDYVTGRDPAVDPVLRGDEMRSIPLVAMTAGGQAARQALAERWARFGHFSWWRPPQEIDLRRVCQDLRAKRRYADALDVCALNAELHPDDWSPWLNFGQTQRAAGRDWSTWLGPGNAPQGANLRKAGLASYRCVVAIEPNHWEANDIRALLAAEDPGDSVPLPPGCPH